MCDWSDSCVDQFCDQFCDQFWSGAKSVLYLCAKIDQFWSVRPVLNQGWSQNWP
nr:MAG TPA: hypothetical protein [Caudoviricetes sp.]